jgi:cytolysin-activating lysine-acyltransferase
MIHIDGTQSDRSALISRDFGTATILMQRTKRYRRVPIGALRAWLNPPIHLKQIRLFYSEDKGLPVAFITWAFLSDEIARRWCCNPRRPFHPSEWNEGTSLWIIDFVARRGYASSVIHYAHSNMFRGHLFARSVRHHADGSVHKVTIWRRRVPMV